MNTKTLVLVFMGLNNEQSEALDMGFPSPAQDYVETVLSPNSLCGITANSRIIETSAGYAVINPALKCLPGADVLIQAFGRTHFAKVAGHAFITADGEALEGEALDDVVVLGRVTHLINRTINDDNCPVI